VEFYRRIYAIKLHNFNIFFFISTVNYRTQIVSHSNSLINLGKVYKLLIIEKFSFYCGIRILFCTNKKNSNWNNDINISDEILLLINNINIYFI